MQAPGCRLCGRVPALEVTLRRQVGMILLGRMFTFKGYLCREHGQATGREWLNKTLVQGWWGIVSFFINIYAVTVDLAALSKLKKLDPPMARPGGSQPPPATGAQPAPGPPIPPVPPPPG